MVNLLGAIGGGALGGAAVNIVINGIDNFSKTFGAVQAGMLKLGTAITAIGVVGGVAVGGLIKVAGQFEQTQIAFTTMLGSGEKAKELLKDLADFASKTPFQISEVEQGAKQLLAYGFGAETIVDNLRMLGDVASGLSIPIGDLVYLHGTLKAQGRAYMMDIRQLANRGIPIYEELAKVLKVDTSEIQKLVSEGKVGFKEVEQAFKNMTSEGGKFFGLTAEQSKTFLGVISNIKDSLEKLARVMGKVFLPAAKWVAEHLALLMGWFEQHPTVATFAAVLLGVGTALALIVGPALIIVAMLPAMAAGLGFVAAGMTAVSIGGAPVWAVMLGIIGVITLLTTGAILLWKHWDTLGIKTKILLGILAPMITIPIAIIKNWDELKVGIAKVWNSIIETTASGVNFLIREINKLIESWNIFRIARGKSAIGTIGEVSFEGALINIDAMLEKQKEVTKEVVEQNKVLTKQEQLVKDAQDAGLAVIRKTGDVFDPMSSALKISDFKTMEAFNLAKEAASSARGLGGPGQEIGTYDSGYSVINISIENINGIDPDEIAKALQDKLRNMIQ